MRAAGPHEVIVHRTGLAGVAAMTLATDRAFPRHAHDAFGIGVVAFGGHRSWSGLGSVEAGPGDVITVNPGEMHDGAPVRGEARGWRILYVEPDRLADAISPPAWRSPVRWRGTGSSPARSRPPSRGSRRRARPSWRGRRLC